MSKLDILEMWYELFLSLKTVPQDYRSQNHTAYIREVGVSVYDLVNELGLEQADYNTDDESYAPVVR